MTRGPLPSGWLRDDHEVPRALAKRRAAVEQRRARITLARVVAFSAPGRLRAPSPG